MSDRNPPQMDVTNKNSRKYAGPDHNNTAGISLTSPPPINPRANNTTKRRKAISAIADEYPIYSQLGSDPSINKVIRNIGYSTITLKHNLFDKI